MPDDVFDDDKFFDDIINDNEPVDKVDPKDVDPDHDKKDGADNDDKDADKDKNKTPSAEERFAALEKENKGLKRAVVEYRQDKSRFKTELDDLKKIIDEGLNKRGSQTADNKDGDNDDDTKSEEKKIDKLPLEFGEDGKGYVKVETLQDTLKEMIQSSGKKVETLERTLTAKEQARELADARAAHINAIIEEKDGRDVAYKELNKGLAILDSKVRELLSIADVPEHIRKNGLLPGQAIQLLESTDGALDDFNKLNLGVDLDVVIRMMDSDWDFKKALDSYKSESAASKTNDDDDDIVQNLKKKPSGPGSVANQKGTDTSIVNKVAGFKSVDILDMDDKTIDKLMERMRREAEE